MDVEFLGPDGGAAGADEEELDTRRRPPARRRWIQGAVVAAALVALGIQVARGSGDGDRRPTADPSTSPTRVAPTQAAPSVTDLVPQPDLPSDVAAISGPAVAVEDTVMAVVGDGLSWIASGDRPGVRTVGISHPAPQYGLIADGTRHQVWLVREGAERTEVTRYDSRGPGADVALHAEAEGTAADATVLDHVLYVTTNVGVYRVSATDDALRLVPTGIRGGLSITADPSRHRLLLIDMDGAPAQVRAQRPGANEALATAPLPFAQGGLRVADGRIWAGGYGYGSDGAVLARLDPRTLRPVGHSPLEPRLGAGALIDAAGTHSLLVRSDAERRRLWCIDASSGAVTYAWPSVPGAAVLGPDGVSELDSSAPATVHLSGPRCS